MVQRIRDRQVPTFDTPQNESAQIMARVTHVPPHFDEPETQVAFHIPYRVESYRAEGPYP